jgi:hypothetical protein
MNYCSQDSWIGDLKHPIYSSKYYLRGSTIFKAIISQVLEDQDPYTNELVIIGSSAGTIGVFNHISWIVNSLNFPVENIQMILDSFYSPITPVEPMQVLSPSFTPYSYPESC